MILIVVHPLESKKRESVLFKWGAYSLSINLRSLSTKVFPSWGESGREFMLFKSSHPHWHLSGIILQKPKTQGDANLWIAICGGNPENKHISFPPTVQWPINNMKKEALEKGDKTLLCKLL